VSAHRHRRQPDYVRQAGGPRSGEGGCDLGVAVLTVLLDASLTSSCNFRFDTLSTLLHGLLPQLSVWFRPERSKAQKDYTHNARANAATLTPCPTRTPSDHATSLPVINLGEIYTHQQPFSSETHTHSPLNYIYVRPDSVRSLASRPYSRRPCGLTFSAPPRRSAYEYHVLNDCFCAVGLQNHGFERTGLGRHVDCLCGASGIRVEDWIGVKVDVVTNLPCLVLLET
jgi:hypothetical protein